MGWNPLKKTFKHLDTFGSTLRGGLGGGGDPGKKQLAEMRAVHAATERRNRSLFAQAGYQQRQGLKEIDKGYKSALSSVGQQGAVAKQAIVDRETQNLGALRAGSASSGMSGTSRDANLQRAVYSDSSRNLANVDAEIGQIMGNLQAQRAGAMAGQYGALAGISQNHAASSNQLGGQLINTLGNVQYADPNSWLQSLFSIGGTALGTSIGRGI